MMIGMFEEARFHAKIMEARLLQVAKEHSEWWEYKGFGPLLDGFVPMVFMVYMRFGKWKEILAEDISKFHSKYSPFKHVISLTVAHYTRGVALASLSRVKEAKVEEKLFKKYYKQMCIGGIYEDAQISNNPLRNIYKIAGRLLNAEIKYREGMLSDNKKISEELIESAFDILRYSVTLNDGGSDNTKELVYDEPWGWMHPIRHIIGALGQEQGKYEEAFEAYTQDLGICTTSPNATMTHPLNIWSLKGLSLLFKVWNKEFNEKEKEVCKWVEINLANAEKTSDTKIYASCAC